MRYYKTILLIFVVAFCSAQTEIKPDSLYSMGNQAMLQENFNTGILHFEQILEQGRSHPDLYYNLGNAYYRINQIGNAVWAYEKGLQLAPRDKDLQFNLALANARVRDRIDMPQASLFLEQYRAIKKSVTLFDLILIAAAIFMMGAFLFFLKKYYRWESLLVSRLIIAIFILSVIIHLVALDKYFEISDINEVIITSQEVEIFSVPFEKRETILFRLHEGVKAEIAQEQDDWLEIVLIDGKKGWIQSSMVRQL